MHDQHNDDHWTGAATTLRHVGRTEEIDQVRAALTAVGTQPQVIFLLGDGGIGKTRLLLRLLDLARELGLTTANALVDLYDIANHSDTWLSRAFYEHLTPPFSTFAQYDREWSRLLRLEISGDVVELGRQRERTLATFLADLRALASQRRVVIALDTAERLVYIVDEHNRFETEIAEEWDWLVRGLERIPNLTLLVAGRPRADLLREALAHAVDTEQVVITTIQLDPFSLEDSLSYFDAVAEAAESSSSQYIAEQLLAMPKEYRALAHERSGGRPITLSLIVDLITIGEFGAVQELLPDTLGADTDAFTGLSLAERLEDKIVKRLIQTPRLGDLLIAVGRLPKGANQDLIGLVLQTPGSDMHDGLQDLSKLSFVKERGGMIFLHDEIYAMLERQVFSAEEDRPRAIAALDAILDYYQRRYDQSLADINLLYQQPEVERRPELDRDKLAEVNNRRRSLLPDMLYYRLRRDALSGFRHYWRDTFEAVISGDTALDVQLQAAILGFLQDRDPDEQNDQVDGLARGVVLGEALVRPVARAYARTRYGEAVERAEHIRTFKAELLGNGGPATLALLAIWEAGSRIRRNGTGDAQQARALFEQAIAITRPFADGRDSASIYTDVLLWRAMGVLAYAYQGLGLVLWSHGEHEAAAQNYQEAIRLWRELRVNVNLATSLNDLGFVLSELGQTDDAQALVLDALGIRRNLGTRAPVGYSLNTLAMIDIRSGNYRQARDRAEQSLALFRALRFSRGVALALNALAESSRRHSAVTYAMGIDERVGLLRFACDYAREAFEIAGQADEPLRQIQAEIELGCASREWARIRRTTPNPRENYQRIASEGREALLLAERLAVKAGLLLQQIIAISNRAFLEYYMGDLQQARRVGEEALTIIPPEYHRLGQAEEPPVDRAGAQVQIWAHLGKLHTLFGHMIFDRYQPGVATASLNDQEFDEAIERYMLALEYTRMYSSQHPGYRLAEGQIYRRLKELPAEALHRVARAVRAAEQRYGLGRSTLQELLTKRALWYQQ